MRPGSIAAARRRTPARSRDGSAVAAAFFLCGLSCGVLPGCARTLVSEDQTRRLRIGEIDPCQVVFIVHGMLKDTGFTWDEDLRDELCDDGRLGVPVTYWSDPTGVWLGWGPRAPARLLAAVADDVARLHEAAGCPVPLRVRALGFSQGGEVVLAAAAELEVATFDRVVLSQPSSFAFSRRPSELQQAGRIGSLEIHVSPVDLVNLLAPLGAGEFGLHAANVDVNHHIHWRWHLPPILRSDRDHYRAALFEEGPDRPGAAEGRGAWTPERRRFAADLARLLERRRSG